MSTTSFLGYYVTKNHSLDYIPSSDIVILYVVKNGIQIHPTILPSGPGVPGVRLKYTTPLATQFASKVASLEKRRSVSSHISIVLVPYLEQKQGKSWERDGEFLREEECEGKNYAENHDVMKHIMDVLQTPKGLSKPRPKRVPYSYNDETEYADTRKTHVGV